MLTAPPRSLLLPSRPAAGRPPPRRGGRRRRGPRGRSLARNSAGVPTKRSFPWVSRATRSEISRACSMSWVTTIDVTCVRSRISRMRREMVAVLTGSSPVTGSSYRRISGRPTMARARPTRFFIPPESSEGSFARTTAGSRFTSSRASHTLRSTSGDRARRASPSGRPRHHVLEDVHRVEEGRVLEDVAHLAPDRGQGRAVGPVHRHPVDLHVSVVRHQEPVRGLEEDALAGARGPDDGERLAGLHGEAHPAQDRRVEGLVDVDVLDHVSSGRAGGRWRPARGS